MAQAATSLRNGWQTLSEAMARAWPGLPGAEASQSCELTRRCVDDPPLSLDGFVALSEYLGFEVEASDAMRSRGDQSLAGVLVLIADMNHFNVEHHHAILGLLQHSLRTGTDKLLAESTRTKSPARDWACLGLPLDEVCHPIEDPVASDASLKATSAAFEAAKALITALQRLGAVFEVGDATAQKVFDDARAAISQVPAFMREGAVAEIAAFEKAWARFNRVLARDTPRRDAHFLKQIRLHAGSGHSTFVVLGSAHIANLKAQVFEQPALLVHAPALRAQVIASTGRDPLAPTSS